MIVGCMALCDFPMAPTLLADLAAHCDQIVIRFDEVRGDEDILHECLEMLREMSIDHISLHSNDPWSRWGWREDLVRVLDLIEPTYVLFPDHDESFPDSWWENEFRWFKKSGKDRALFLYEMATEDDRTVDTYPLAAHCKAFKWRDGLTFQPYLGYAIPGGPGLEDKETGVYEVQGLMKHFCFYTEEMQRTKTLHK